MATLVLGAVGYAVAGPFGGFVGSALGSYLDQAYIMPALFPKEPLEGPKLDDLSVQLASEGSPDNMVYGPLNRCAGNVIWKTDLIPHKSTKKVGGSTASQKFNEYTYTCSVAIKLADATTRKINAVRRVWADGKLIWDGTTLSRVGAMRFYDGTQTEPDPFIEAIQGVGHTPAFMDACYVFLEDVYLEQNNNHIPTFHFQIEEDSDVSCGEAIGKILVDAGFDSTEYDTSRIPYCFKGYQVRGPQTTVDKLNPIMVTYAITAYELDDVLTFVPRGAEDTYVLNMNHLSAHEENNPDEAVWPIEWEDRGSRKITSNFQMRFTNQDKDLLAGSERQFRAVFDAENTASADVPLTFNSEQARSIVRMMLWRDEVCRFQTRFSLLPQYIWLHEGTVLRVNRDGIDYDVFILSVRRGDNWLVQVDAQVQVADVFTQKGVSSGARAATTNQPPPPTTAYVLDIPAMTSDQYERTGVYTAICNTTLTDRWVGASTFVSFDGANYVWIANSPVETVIGETGAALPKGPVYLWDESSVLTVTVLEGSLEPCTDDECLMGRNRAAVRASTGEWEIIAFVNATLVGTNTYELSRLLRGLRGTEHLVGLHFAGDAFVLLQNDGSIGWGDVGSDAIGSVRQFKFPSRGQELSAATNESLTFRARTMQCAAPVQTSTELSGTDIVVNWVRRSRRVVFPFNSDDAPFCADELPERYEVEIFADDGYTFLRRTTTATGATTITYTTAEQTADGILTPGGEDVHFKIYQISNVTGRGVPATAEFHP